MLKIDLHTHSYGSLDGGISLAGYRRALRDRKLHYIAVTDHNTIEAAQAIHKVLGDRIIVGEEIMTQDGEVIGLYLRKAVEPHRSLADTVADIKAQHGLVLIPHPFETVRKGVSMQALQAVKDDIDMIEIRNGRALFQNRSQDARAVSKLHEIAGVAASDAHSTSGLGKTYTSIPHRPSKQSLVALLAAAEHATQRARLPSLLAPKLNRVSRRLRRTNS